MDERYFSLPDFNISLRIVVFTLHKKNNKKKNSINLFRTAKSATNGQQDKPQKARCTRTDLSTLDTAHKLPYSFEKAIHRNY